VLQQPLIILLQQHGTDQPGDAGLVGEDADDIGPPLHLLLYPGPRIQWLIFVLLTSSAFAGVSGSLGGSLLYELGAASRLRMGYGQELEGASLLAAS